MAKRTCSQCDHDAAFIMTMMSPTRDSAPRTLCTCCLTPWVGISATSRGQLGFTLTPLSREAETIIEVEADLLAQYGLMLPLPPPPAVLVDDVLAVHDVLKGNEHGFISLAMLGIEPVPTELGAGT